jgi:hypothetical protein
MGTEAQVKSALLSAKKKQRLRAMALAALGFAVILYPFLVAHRALKLPSLQFAAKGGIKPTLFNLLLFASCLLRFCARALLLISVFPACLLFEVRLPTSETTPG